VPPEAGAAILHLRRGSRICMVGMWTVGKHRCYSRHASLTYRLLALLVLITLALLSSSPEQFHRHDATGPGLYNADCPLAAIAARHGQASLPSSLPAVSTAWTASILAIVAPIDLGTQLPLHSESRAPPLS
jgi:hypothetical protein